MEQGDALRGRNIVIWDAEIKATIDGVLVGWKDYAKMGISVACLKDYETGDLNVYMDDNIEELTERLNRADLVVGFNILGFDIPLLNATTTLKTRPDLPVYDILYESRRACGGNPDAPYGGGIKGLKLDNHLKGTFGQKFMKTEHGSQAPILYQTKQRGRLISYCLADVAREAALFEHIIIHKTLITDTHGIKIPRQPSEVFPQAFRIQKDERESNLQTSLNFV